MSWVSSHYRRLAMAGRAVEVPSCSGNSAAVCDRGPQLLLGCSGAAAADIAPGRVVLPVAEPSCDQSHLPPDLRHAELTW